MVDAQAKLIESEIAYSLSEQKLINLDLNKDQIRKIQDGDSKFDLLPLTTNETSAQLLLLGLNEL